MKYLLKNEHEILDLFLRSATITPMCEGEFLSQISEDELILPEYLYKKESRPEYIKVRSTRSFDVLGGVFGKNTSYAAECMWEDSRCVIHITRKISKHVVAEAEVGLTDVASAKIISIEESVDLEYSDEIPVNVNGRAHTVRFVSGRGEVSYDYSLDGYPDTCRIVVDSHFLEIPSNRPGNIMSLDWLKFIRNNLLSSCDWLISRHLSQPDNVKTLSPEQYAELQAYMQALRDLPASADLSNIVWPAKPEFV